MVIRVGSQGLKHGGDFDGSGEEGDSDSAPRRDSSRKFSTPSTHFCGNCAHVC